VKRAKMSFFPIMKDIPEFLVPYLEGISRGSRRKKMINMR